MMGVDKSLYPQFFDTIVSSSIDSIRRELAPKDNIFAAEHFGFNPIASKSFLETHQSIRKDVQQDPNTVSLSPNVRPQQYNIQTIHDPNYRVYKEEQEEGTEILDSLKRNPAVANYFQPIVNAAVNHPLNYRKEDAIETLEGAPNYKSIPYITGPARIRRYTKGRSRENLRRKEDDEDNPYDYSSEYVAIPKAFKGSLYGSYKEDKDSKDKYEYPYKYDSGYDHKEYDRIKELSEKQAAEIRQNPGNCKEVKRDGMSCMVCKDPKTGGNYESCSYQAEPKNNKYAYSKEKKFDSNDEPEGQSEEKAEPEKLKKYQEAKDETSPQKFTDASANSPSGNYKKQDADDSDGKYKAYYIHTSNPKPSESLRAQSEESEDDSKESKGYDYKKALPGFYSDNEPKKNVEHVLAEFKKKDRSACKKVHKNGMTCYQCIDKAGLKNEECMFVSESAPKQSHLAYQEVKEFTSKPATLEGGNEGAESQTITTSTPPKQKSGAYVAATNTNKEKQKRKKVAQTSLSSAATSPVAQAIDVTKQVNSKKVKRSSDKEEDVQLADETNIAPPEEFAGAESKGAFWAETMPRYSADLGVSLPEYMLSGSEHEASFDELVAGA
ncbi:unnamed protein product [Leptosia nina]|uniref:Uncharacterized protein n=1 Tax=Leptosia nina TaxID=320188 RepID=A0AAV1JRK8_9NEOP